MTAKGVAATHEVAVVATAGVVVLEPALELGGQVGQASEVLAVEGRPVELLEGGALEALADRVVVGRARRDAMVVDAEVLQVAGDRLAGELGAVEFLMVVKAPGWGQAGWWDGRHRGALGDSLLDALVPPAVAATGVADRSAGGPDFCWDLVALGDNRSALGGGDRAAIDIAQLVGGVVAQAGDDPGEQHGGDGAQRRGVVAAGLAHEPLVAGGKGGVGLAGVVGGQEQRFAQAGVALFGWAAGGLGEARGTLVRNQPGEGPGRGQAGEIGRAHV